MTTTNLRPEALELFVTCFNLCYPDWTVSGLKHKPLQPRHVDFDTNLRSCWGRCGPRRNGRVYYRVNADWWADSTNGGRIGLTLHELAHVQENSHSPEFWEQVTENYHELTAHASDVEAVLDGSTDWSEVDEFLVTDPGNGLVDNRRETAYERRRKIAEAIDYSGDVSPFEQMRILTRQGHDENHEEVELDQLQYDDYSLDEVLSVFRAKGTGVSMDGDYYIIEPPVVEQRNGHYVVVDGGRRVELAKRAIFDGSTRTKLSVKVAERE